MTVVSNSPLPLNDADRIEIRKMMFALERGYGLTAKEALRLVKLLRKIGL